jgi:acyl-CoA reductase-like NAD-dependent aldehyde dehydrogenase
MADDHCVYGPAAVDLQNLMDRVAQRLLENTGICCTTVRYVLAECLDRDARLLASYREAVDAMDHRTDQIAESVERARVVTKRGEVAEAATFWRRVFTMEVWNV